MNCKFPNNADNPERTAGKRAAAKRTHARGTAALSLLAVCFSVSAMAGCSSAPSASSDGTPSSAVTVNAADMFTSRDADESYDESTAVRIALADGGSSSSSASVSIDGDRITVSEAGTYILSGALTNGQIVVETEKTEKVQLVFDGVSVSNASSAALYVKRTDKVFVTLAAGSKNSLSTEGTYVAIDDNNIDAAVFSKEDITFNGSGELSVRSAYGHGIVSKDDLVFTGGGYTVTAASHALSGKDSVRIADGSFTLTAGKDGIHAENPDDASSGYIYVKGGSFTIASDGDGLDAGYVLQLAGGDFDVTAGGGSSKNVSSSDSSMKGLKAVSGLTVSGGSYKVDSADDALHCNGSVEIDGGELTLSTGDDGIHADESLIISDGEIAVAKSYEGLEGLTIDITGGAIYIVSSDDGINAAGGNDQSGMGGPGMGGMWQDRFNTSDSGGAYLRISGGYLEIEAGGDGLDSNGNLYVEGGEIYISGPTSGADGAIDSGDNATAKITGGKIVALCTSGMTETFGSAENQGVISLTVSSSKNAVSVKDSSGNTVLSYTPTKTYSYVVVSCPEIVQGGAYTVTAGGQEYSVTMTGLLYSSGGGSFGPGGGRR